MSIRLRTERDKTGNVSRLVIVDRTINLLITKIKRDNSYTFLEEESEVSKLQASRSPLRGQKNVPRPHIFKLYK